MSSWTRSTNPKWFMLSRNVKPLNRRWPTRYLAVRHEIVHARETARVSMYIDLNVAFSIYDFEFLFLFKIYEFTRIATQTNPRKTTANSGSQIGMTFVLEDRYTVGIKVVEVEVCGSTPRDWSMITWNRITYLKYFNFRWVSICSIPIPTQELRRILDIRKKMTLYLSGISLNFRLHAISSRECPADVGCKMYSTVDGRKYCSKFTAWWWFAKRYHFGLKFIV